MTHGEYLNLIGQDPDEDLIDDDTYRMEIMDRLLDFAPAGAPNLTVPSASSSRSLLPRDVSPGRRHVKTSDSQRQEHAARARLYGCATRSGTVTHRGANSHSIQTVQSDVPFGMTLSEWGADQAAARTA